MFSCCSSYVECSEELRCLHVDNPLYDGCNYRKNLVKGKIFYGKNVGNRLNIKNELLKKSKEIYLLCWERLFAIREKSKNGWSRELSIDQVETLKVTFDDNAIPFMTVPDTGKCFIDRPDKWDNSPANSRVVLKLYGQSYHILNYNDYLIKRRYAEKIVAAFKGKGFDCDYELVGRYSNVDSVPVGEKNVAYIITKDTTYIEPVKTPVLDVVKPIRYVQSSIFDLLLANKVQSQFRG